ncbi:flp pilus-assembly TadE/G-like family protein, partial [Kribbella solani]|uniref:flp pilus-assembly TadE/G-like family protein n=1 Tax=Kribbella solani TaxID=236067 RepID=UPI0029B41BA5
RERGERGSLTVHAVFAAVLLMAAVGAAMLWSSISTARHKVAAAADLTALSAAQSLVTDQPTAAPVVNEQVVDRVEGAESEGSEMGDVGGKPCEVAVRVAGLNGVRVIGCVVDAGAVTVRVSVQVELPVGTVSLDASARAGPV